MKSAQIGRGSPDTFAIRIAFLPDPDSGRAATPEESASWGGLEIWVNGNNVCRHLELGEPTDRVHWYLLPFLRWLTANWDFLLHEERLPGRVAAADGWTSLTTTWEAPPTLSEGEVEFWEDRWHGWWDRHALLSCRSGGLLPDLVIRRWNDLIEFSWGHTTVPGTPDHVRFVSHPGFHRLDPVEVASTMYEVLSDAVRHLQDNLPESVELGQLVEDVKRIQSADSNRRIALLAGLNRSESEEPPSDIEAVFPPLSGEVHDAVFGVEENVLVIRGTCQAALMFGSLDPNVNSSDAKLLATQLVELYSPEGEGPRLKGFVRSMTIDDPGTPPWRRGYALAENFLDDYFPESPNAWIDVESICRDLEIEVREIELSDGRIRAVAIAGPRHRAAILVNTTCSFSQSSARRFTLAHELCHLLHDRSYGARVAMASGPWAPVDVEKRANAFAAMCLMPSELIARTVAQLDVELASNDGIGRVAERLQTSYQATLNHLCNLGFFDDAVRDQLRQVFET